MNLGLSDRAVLVTGAASGIGRATAVAFAAEGARVTIADLDETGARATAEIIRTAGGVAGSVAGDVSTRADAVRYVDAAVERYGQLDVIVNNAGVEAFGTLADTTDEVWERMLGVNAKGPYMVIQAALPHLEAGGVIVNVASGAGLRGNAGLAAYSAAKAALVHMTRCLAREVGGRNVRVNAIAPGWIDTPTGRRWSDLVGGVDQVIELLGDGLVLKRPGTPEDVANAIVFLASDAASYLTGVVLPVDGGMTA